MGACTASCLSADAVLTLAYLATITGSGLRWADTSELTRPVRQLEQVIQIAHHSLRTTERQLHNPCSAHLTALHCSASRLAGVTEFQLTLERSGGLV